jgi:DNA-binding NtrC family response regulator
MTYQDVPGGSVLIIDPDESIRRMIATLLERAGFECTVADDVTNVMFDEPFDVIVRDVNLAPGGRALALWDLARTAPQLLQQTIITTTEPVSLLNRHGITAPFAVVRKPFDLNTLLGTVRKCRDRQYPGGGDGTRAGRERQLRE